MKRRVLRVINTCSIKQPDLHYFEAIKMTSQALSNFVWRIRAAGEIGRLFIYHATYTRAIPTRQVIKSG